MNTVVIFVLVTSNGIKLGRPFELPAWMNREEIVDTVQHDDPRRSLLATAKIELKRRNSLHSVLRSPAGLFLRFEMVSVKNYCHRLFTDNATTWSAFWSVSCWSQPMRFPNGEREEYSHLLLKISSEYSTIVSMCDSEVGWTSIQWEFSCSQQLIDGLQFLQIKRVLIESLRWAQSGWLVIQWKQQALHFIHWETIIYR